MTYGSRDKDNGFDGLRVIAAWLVLFNHSYPLTGANSVDVLTQILRIDTSGGLAVCIFFVISGYLVTISLEHSESVLDFCKKRCLRIYPGLLGLIVFTIFLMGPVATKKDILEYFRDPATWQYFKTFSGFTIKYDLPGVFADNPASGVNGSLWSLAIELRCYIVLALIGFLPFGMRVKSTLILFFLFSAFVARPPVDAGNVDQKYLGLSYYYAKYGLVFAIGMFVAAWKEIFDLKREYILFFVLLLGLSFSLTWPDIAISSAVYCVSVALITLWIGLNFQILTSVTKRIGDISYGIYLYAFPVQQLLTSYKIHGHGLISYIVLSSLITAILAYVSWIFIERPAISFKYK